MLLHKGSTREKIIAFAVANGFMELRRHKTTSSFLRIFHDCMGGMVPSRLKRFTLHKDYREVYDIATTMALMRRDNPQKALAHFEESINGIYQSLVDLKIRLKNWKKSGIFQKVKLKILSIR
jgi:hypothetical protein